MFFENKYNSNVSNKHVNTPIMICEHAVDQQVQRLLIQLFMLARC